MRRSIACCLSLTLLLAVFFAPLPGRADQLMKLPPEMRLLRGTTDQGEVSYDAVVSRMQFDQLPGAVQDEVKAKILGYAGDLKQLNAVLVYFWDGPWFHSQNLPPNYVVDFSAIKPAEKLAPALTDPPCNDEGCLVAGYTYFTNSATGAGAWKQDFELRSTKTNFARVNLSDGKNFQVEIRSYSNKPACAPDGVQTDQGCLRRFSWRKFGLAALPPQPPQ
jgi:hypothetical protein